MVWFQCEDCGENLKKPKLQNHFRGCSAQKLSCIDCGVVFNQQSVQGHTQCISEAEKYGPKNMGSIKKEVTKTLSKEQHSEAMDVSLGLSARQPWSCSLCNVKATSQETLMLHAQGKKHKAKVRAMCSKASNGDVSSEITLGAMVPLPNGKLPVENKYTVAASTCDGKDLCNSKVDNGLCGINNEQTSEKKKRKSAREQNGPISNAMKKEKNGVGGSCTLTEERSGRLVKHPKLEQLHSAQLDDKSEGTQCNTMTSDGACVTLSSLVKWKKMIKRTLKTAPSGAMKIKKLHKSVLPLIMETMKTSGLEVDKEALLLELDKQIHSYAKLAIEGKKVRLVVKDTVE